MDPVERLANLLEARASAVAFTGAGISTESGIPDFRSPGGVWARNAPVMYDDFVRDRRERVRFWKMRRELYPLIRDARPNDGHRALARLEAAGVLGGVITQNIDGLHQAAGSRRVLELHGTARRVACIGCGREWPPEEIIARLNAGDDAPDCEECGAPLKSKTVSFGQPMPEGVMAESVELARAAGVFLAIGSSLVVEPAASLPRVAAYGGAALVIINNASTPLDEMAELLIREPIGATLSRLQAYVERGRPAPG
ncbi:MAG: NAD-dependent deacylase [Planctomycetes bacterium]|nr:NAD-dependent deacylase [Planctomycetota bacterium]